MNLIDAVRLADDLFYGRVLPERIPSRRLAEAMHTLSLNVKPEALEYAREELEAETTGLFNH